MLLLVVHNPSHSTLYGASALLGASFGVTNAYSTRLWQHFYGDVDAHRIRYASIAITTSATGIAVWIFALSRQEMSSYLYVLNTSALMAGGLAGMISRTSVAPMERIKILFQGQSSNTTEVKNLL